MRLRFCVTSSSDKQDMSVSSWTRVVFESQTILLVLTLAWKTYSKRRLVDCFFNEGRCVAILKYEVNKMDVGRRQPSATFVISRASLRSARKVVSRSQLRFADGRDGRRDGYWLSLPRRRSQGFVTRSCPTLGRIIAWRAKRTVCARD